MRCARGCLPACVDAAPVLRKGLPVLSFGRVPGVGAGIPALEGRESLRRQPMDHLDDMPRRLHISIMPGAATAVCPLPHS